MLLKNTGSSLIFVLALGFLVPALGQESENLPRRPVVTPIPGYIEGSPFFSNYFTPDDKKIGFFQGTCANEDAFEIEYKVEPEFKGKGVSKFFTAEFFSACPDAKRVQAELVADNLAAFKLASSKGLSAEDAVRATPFMKVLEDFGFVIIKSLEVGDEIVILTVEKAP